MVSSDVWDEETAAAYDTVEAAPMSTPEVVGPTVEFLARLAGPGPALEFAVGTGRIAVPLARRGVPVTGIELSEPMAARLRAKTAPGEVPVVVGDMATTRVPGRYRLVYLVWNTISNLQTQDEQAECFANAARHLAPGGRFVIEVSVPPLRRMPPGQGAVPFEVSEAHTGFDTLDPVTQRMQSHHFWRRPDGTVRHEVGHFRYVWPSECDLMARLAGLVLEDRFADWERRPFTAESEGHVSVWRRPPA